jgi:hypothetical protein
MRPEAVFGRPSVPPACLVQSQWWARLASFSTESRDTPSVKAVSNQQSAGSRQWHFCGIQTQVGGFAGPLEPSSDEPDEIGLRTVFLSNYGDRSERFRGITRLMLKYLDDSLASFEIHYNTEVTWESDAHFAAAIAELLRLPTTGWVNQYQPTLLCAGFLVKVRATIGGILTIERRGFEDEIKERTANRDRKKRI